MHYVLDDLGIVDPDEREAAIKMWRRMRALQARLDREDFERELAKKKAGRR